MHQLIILGNGFDLAATAKFSSMAAISNAAG